MKEKEIHRRSKLNLDFSIVEKARLAAKNIALDTQKFIDQHTTTTIERTVCRLFGIDGVDEFDVPLPNIVVDNIQKGNGLGIGAAIYLGNAVLHTNLSPQEIAEKVAKDELDLTKLSLKDISEIKATVNIIAQEKLALITQKKRTRDELLKKYGDKEGPLIYVIVATGNIFEDIIQAQAAARQGANVIAVIRSTVQS